MIIHGDSLDVLKTLDDESVDVMVSDLQAGKAGEYLVCADLILKGYIAFPSEQGLPYDVIAEVDNRLIRIQVKTTRTYRAIPQRAKYTPAYLFNARRCGKGGRRRYDFRDFDVMAFVALNEKAVWYLPLDKVSTTMQFRTRKFAYRENTFGRYIEDLSFENCL